MTARQDIRAVLVEQTATRSGGLLRLGVGPEAPLWMVQLGRRMQDVARDDGPARDDADVPRRVARGFA
ncbi:hypothetical protein [Amycolatopsis minnesotensis]|uniref:Uncharacterized protein n=1 Tax=Amycolatopsis minnesotensis TaxID=337894 RepID=A0ABN2SQT1_9PSEU